MIFTCSPWRRFSFRDEIDKRHVPYDVIGLSMYTYWNGPISALKANMDDISKRYNKDVIVVEAAYAYTLANCDNAENSFQAKEDPCTLAGYPPSFSSFAWKLFSALSQLARV